MTSNAPDRIEVVRPAARPLLDCVQHIQSALAVYDCEVDYARLRYVGDEDDRRPLDWPAIFEEIRQARTRLYLRNKYREGNWLGNSDLFEVLGRLAEEEGRHG